MVMHLHGRRKEGAIRTSLARLNQDRGYDRQIQQAFQPHHAPMIQGILSLW